MRGENVFTAHTQDLKTSNLLVSSRRSLTIALACCLGEVFPFPDPSDLPIAHQIVIFTRLPHNPLSFALVLYLKRVATYSGISIPAKDFTKACREICQVCVMAKHGRAPFKSRTSHPERPGEEFHTDIAGPYPVLTLGGGKYVITLVFGKVKLVAVSILKTKDGAVEELRRWIIKFETQLGVKCKVLFSDRGGEYITDILRDWLEEKGIVHDKSCPAVKPTNGIAERVNHSLNNMTRALMIQYKTHEPLWGYAMMYAARLRNLAYNLALGMTPFEAFYGKVPDVSKIRTFGCKVCDAIRGCLLERVSPL